MKKRTKRKVWNLVNPIAHAIDGACITPANLLSKIHMRELSSIEALATGTAGLAEWHDLVAVSNLSETLATLGVGGKEVLDACKSAEKELIEAAERYQKIGKMGLSGPGIQAMRDIVEWHHLQRTSISRADYSEAIRLTAARAKTSNATIDLTEKLGRAKT